MDENGLGGIEQEFWQDFILEAYEHLENVEAAIIKWENEPDCLEIVHDLFRAFHSLKGLAGFVDQELIQQLAHATETVLHACRNGQLAVCRGIADKLLYSHDLIMKICNQPAVVHESSFVTAVAAHLSALQAVDIPIEDSVDKVSSREMAAMAATSIQVESSYVRIPAIKVDNLADLLGELLVTQSQVEQSLRVQTEVNTDLSSAVNRMARIGKEIQSITMSMRMISLKPTFQKVVRIARDAMAELDKNIHIEVIGEETEIDRSVAERLIDPLLHLVKNCISHAIEPEAERLRQGKAAMGQIQIRAYSKRGSVHVVVSDDGQGIDLQRVLQKAVEQGLAEPGENYSPDEVTRFLFQPGFSTKKTVDTIAGRGVGLDVVQAEIRKLGGRVEVRSSRGKGTEFELKIPINQAVTDGTIIVINGNRYILPTQFVKRIVSTHQGVQDTEWVTLHGRNSALRLGQEVIPLISVGQLYPQHLATAAAQYPLVIVLELEQAMRVMPVEAVLGKQEVVVKAMGAEFSQVEFLAGASILGDGGVALILDVESIFRIGDEDKC